MRAVQSDAVWLDDTFSLTGEFTQFMDECIQCRACEAVCPSLVPFGHLMEGARRTLTETTDYQPRWRRAGYAVLGRHRLLLALSSMAAIAQRLHLAPRAFALPPLPVRRQKLEPSVPTGRVPAMANDEVWLFPGCVMDAWMRPTHRAAQRVIEATGARVAFPGSGAACCGALHTHAGLVEQARTLAMRVMASMPGDAPIIVDSAGCGAALKEYGHLLGTDEAAAFAARVADVHEWLAPRIDRLPVGRNADVVAVQDPCHLRHVQRAHQHVRTVLAPYVDVRELDDEGLCCGAGGSYFVSHPAMATELRARKVEAIERTGARVIASANPGCAMWLRAAGLDVRHPIDIIADAIDGRES